MDKKQGQIKSKKRVAEHGEVFTNEREVKAMCDLVAQGHLLRALGKGVLARAQEKTESEQKYQFTVHIFQESTNLTQIHYFCEI